MNAKTYRAFAAISLLCILPRASALVLTVTQTTSIAISSQTSGGMSTRGGVSWLYAPFDPTLGDLEGVTLTASITAYVHAADRNLYGDPFNIVPIDVTPFVSLSLAAVTTDFPAAFAPSAPVRSNGAPVTVQPFQGFNYGDTLTTSLAGTFTGDLRAFSGLIPPPLGGTPHVAILQATAEGYGVWDSVRYNGTITTSLTYSYRVPEGGSPLPWFAVCIIACAALHNQSVRFIRQRVG